MDGGQCRSVNTLYPTTTILHYCIYPRIRLRRVIYSFHLPLPYSFGIWHLNFFFLFFLFGSFHRRKKGKKKKTNSASGGIYRPSPGSYAAALCVCVYVARTVKEIASRSSEQFFRREFSSSALSLSAGKTRNDGREERRVIRKEKEIKKGKEDASVHFPLSVKRSQVLPICTTTTVYLPPTSGNPQFILSANEAAQQQRLLYTYM